MAPSMAISFSQCLDTNMLVIAFNEFISLFLLDYRPRNQISIWLLAKKLASVEENIKVYDCDDYMLFIN